MAEVFDFGLQQHKIKMDGKFFENNLFAVAGDTGRRLEVQLLDSDNLVQNTTGISLRLNANVAGQATYAEATLVDATKGLYQLDLPNGMLIAPGNWQFQWQIIGATGDKLHSFAFTGSIGSNLSEGGSEATNFYLNADELKQMQDDLINGTFDSEVLETNIAEKLNNLEEQYAPKLTEVTAQLADKSNQSDVIILGNRLTELTSIQEGMKNFKGSKTTAEIYAITNGVDGDYYYSIDDFAYFRFDGTSWHNVGSINREVSDTRIGADGTVFDTAGNAVRSQLSALFNIPANYWTAGNQKMSASSGNYRSTVISTKTLEQGKMYDLRIGLYSNILDNRLATIGFKNDAGESVGTNIYYNKTDDFKTFTVPIGATVVEFSLWMNNGTAITSSRTAYWSNITLTSSLEGSYWRLKLGSLPSHIHSKNDVYGLNAQLDNIVFNSHWLVTLTGGAYPIIDLSGTGSSTKATVSFSQTDCTIWVRGVNGNYREGNFYKPAGATFNLNNNQALKWDLDNNRLFVGDLAQESTAVIILLYNSYGTLYGHWSEFYYRNMITELNKSPKKEFAIPDYYQSHLDLKIKEIQSLERAAGKDGESFVFITDIHAQDNDTVSFSLIKAIRERTNAKKVFNGGDFINAGEKAKMLPYFYQVKEKAAFMDSGYYVVRGNHENNPYSVGNEISNDEVYSMIFKDQEKYVGTNEFYYSVDNAIQKIKYIVFDTGTDGQISDEQFNWFQTTVESTDADWSIFIVVHWIVGGAELNVNAGMKKVFDYIDSYSGAVTFIGGLCGHIHRDYTIQTTSGKTFLSTTCDTPNQQSANDPIARTAGTINQQAFDVVVINKKTKMTNLVRIGAGSNRSFSY